MIRRSQYPRTIVDVELLNELRAGQTLTAVVLALASIGAGLLASALGYGLGTHA